MIISVLVEAQAPDVATAGRRKAGPCPLRAMRRADVAYGEGAKLAAAVSLVLASAKVSDHVEDGDGLYARRPVAGGARKVAQRWARQGADTAAGVGFDTAVLVDAVGRQSGVEAAVASGATLLDVTEPTETATAAAFAHTAILGGRPGNAETLSEAGRLFGRLAHLLDAVEDVAEDRATGAWNPLLATGTGPAEAYRLCSDASSGIKLALADAEFTDASLVHVLLVHEVDQAVERTFSHAGFGHLVEKKKRHGAGCSSRKGKDRNGVDASFLVVPDGPKALEAQDSWPQQNPGQYPDPHQYPQQYPQQYPPQGYPQQGQPQYPGQQQYPGQEQYPGQQQYPGQYPPPDQQNPYANYGGPGGPSGWDNGGGGGSGGGGGNGGKYPRNPALGCLVWVGMCCTCQACCRTHYPDPCDGHPREGLCCKCDCNCDGDGCAQCCSICECCECCTDCSC